jgi:hypothetical protein
VPGRVPPGPLSPSVRQLITPTAERLARRLGSGPVTRDVAEIVVRRADHRVGSRGSRRLSEVEGTIEAFETGVVQLLDSIATTLDLDSTATTLDQVNAKRRETALTVACLYRWEFDRNSSAEPDEQLITVRARELHFMSDPRGEWNQAGSALQRAPGPRAEAMVSRLLFAELRSRVPDGQLGWVRDAAAIGARDAVRRWHGRLLRHGDIAHVRRAACVATWRLVVNRFIKGLPLRELEALVGRSFVNRDGQVSDEELDEARMWLTTYSSIVDLTDDGLLKLLARSTPRADPTHSTVELSPNDGAPPEHVPDLLDDPELTVVIASHHERLKACVAAAMEALEAGEGTSPRDAAILRLVTSRGDYDNAALLKVKRAYANRAFVPRENAKRDANEAQIAMKRAYDALRARLTHDGFLLLDEPEGEGERREAILDSSRHLLPSGRGVPPSDPALVSELAGAPLQDVLAETTPWPKREAGEEAWSAVRTALVDLNQARRSVRTAIQGRALYEPVIHDRTDLPDGLASHLRMPANRPPNRIPDGCQRAGRTVLVGRTTPPAVPIERKHDEMRHINRIPRLPEPLIKTHVGRYWYFPTGGVGC